MIHDASGSVAAEARSSLFAAYAAPAASYDELFTAARLLRPHWSTIVAALDGLGQQELARRWEQARRMIHENGVTYNVYGDPRGMDRPWELDAIPLLIPPEEWATLEAALVQRARLLNAVLVDVYGRQQCMGQGLLPAELVFAHAGFLRPCHGLPVPQACYLHLYAADLARAADGQWWVLADRTQSPAGAGYALENRLVLSQVWPDLFQQCQVRRLAPFFAALRQTLLDMAPRHRDNPRIVLLTPGPYNETYFEHSYLARYLGYPLVEGGDLTVRDQRVFLKTLAGLQPVDVILRRLDDSFCDPLALHPGSVLGVAGLVQAVRAGTVTMVNALGSGWVESAALMPFLPALCRHLLGEALALPSVPTWWCGQEEAMAYVLDHLETLILAPALPTRTHEMVFGNRLSRRERQQFVAQVRARPYAYAAQQLLTPSSVPVWQDTGVQPRRTVFRAYVVATANGYQVMPGGLTRVSTASGKPIMAMQSDSGSKDTWVLAVDPPEAFSLLPPAGQPIRLRRSGYDLPSRVLDNLLWMGRYAERVEGLIRLLRSLLVRLTNEAGPGGSAAVPALLRALHTTWDIPSPSVPALDGTAALGGYEQTLVQAMFDTQLASSVCSTCTALHRVSAMVRDYMTLECWHIITHLKEDFTPPQSHDLRQWSDALALINRTIMTLSAFSGLGVENMIRGPEWRFLDMGRRIERALHTISLLRSTVVMVDAQEGTVLQALLEIGDSSITYRSRYRTTLQAAPVLDLLLTDDTNPRAVVYQLVELAKHVEHLPRDHSMPSLSPAQRLVMTMLTTLRLADVETLCQSGRHGRRSRLEAVLSQLVVDLPAFSDTITSHYLSHAEPPRHLAASGA
jgi:uncharacterized circularly permuted ATP-grasp superfamily protein/uncharacterized alpha-E superfamily protein